MATKSTKMTGNKYYNNYDLSVVSVLYISVSKNIVETDSTNHTLEPAKVIFIT